MYTVGQYSCLAAVFLDTTVLHGALKEIIQIFKVSIKNVWIFFCHVSKDFFLYLGDALRSICKGRHPLVCTNRRDAVQNSPRMFLPAYS